jgi:deoxyribose-phosphate aldolase
MLGGADFIKTSTGKVPACPPRCPSRSSCSKRCATSPRCIGTELVGVKVAGGIRTSKDAIRYLVLVNETVGVDVAHSGSVPLRRVVAVE